jgi:hypothetical protein
MSAERDGRPVIGEPSSSHSGSVRPSVRIARSEQCSTLRVGDISTRGLGRYDMGGVVVSKQRGSRHGHRTPDTAIGHGAGHGRGRRGEPRRAARRREQGRCCRMRFSGAPALRAATGRGACRDERMHPMPPTALSGPKGPTTPTARAIGRSLRHGLSRSASPPLQLASLRRPESRLLLERRQSPPVVSAAFLVTVARLSVTRYPRIARLDILLIATQRQRQNVEPGHVPPVRPFSCSAGPENHGPP